MTSAGENQYQTDHRRGPVGAVPFGVRLLWGHGMLLSAGRDRPAVHHTRKGRAPYFVPKIRSPASPRPGQYSRARSDGHPRRRSRCPRPGGPSGCAPPSGAASRTISLMFLQPRFFISVMAASAAAGGQHGIHDHDIPLFNVLGHLAESRHGAPGFPHPGTCRCGPTRAPGTIRSTPSTIPRPARRMGTTANFLPFRVGAMVLQMGSPPPWWSGADPGWPHR